MTITKFMTDNLRAVRMMIAEIMLNDTFDSHEFIRRFAKRFESAYNGFLGNYNSHRTVHAQLALNLLRNTEFLGIQKNGEVWSESVFGFVVPNKEWVKLNQISF